ncbi:MAG: peptide chain release factor N(5)-glutamine methyltransferase [Bacteroidales bacterium]|nr:peptide chain release factor N(5)-glutamine methyltransferase [Bacteroidales bacterium]
MLLSDFIRDGAARLETLYPSPEARGLVLMLCEELLGTMRYTHIVEPETAVPEERFAELEDCLQRLCAGEPVQYVLGVAEFCSHRFAVGPGVLIPRPETELLVAEAVRTLREMDLERAPKVLDLCTGSGCIAWSIALEIRDAEVIGLDLSEIALEYARNQFSAGGAPLFLQADVLDTEQEFPCGPFDLIVSNPPYVRESERALMRPNVLEHEPPMALFVPDDDPLRFYCAIARWAQRFLRPGGVGIVEINEALGEETAAVFHDAGFENVKILPDFYKKTRFISFNVI